MHPLNPLGTAVVVAAVTATLTAQAATVPFELVVGPGPAAAEGNGIAVDTAGNIFVTGQHQANKFVDGVTLGTLFGQDVPTFGRTDYFLAKYDPTGGPVWIRTAGSTEFDYGTSVLVASNGDLVVTGRIGAADFHGQTLAPRGPFDAFVARYGTDGSLKWARTGGGDGWVNFVGQLADYDYATGAALDEAGNVYVVGRVYGSASFGASTIGSSSQYTCFLARYSADGELAWVKKLFGSTDLGVAAIASHGGKLFITGTLSDTVDGSSRKGIFTGRYGLDGSREWLVTHEARTSDGGADIAVDAAGNAYVAGTFSSASLQFGGSVLDNPDFALRGFVAKYGADGTPLWIQRTGSRAYGVSVTPAGTVSAVGFYQSGADVAGETLPGVGSQDGYLLRLSTDGDVESLIPVASSSRDILRAITADAAGRLYLTGESAGPAFGARDIEGVVVVARTGPNAPAVPRLALQADAGGLAVSWDAKTSGFVLEGSATLGGAFDSNIPGLESVPGRANAYWLPIRASTYFLRLVAP